MMWLESADNLAPAREYKFGRESDAVIGLPSPRLDASADRC
jgi:hypothetical protein